MENSTLTTLQTLSQLAMLGFTNGIALRIRQQGLLNAMYFALARFQFVRRFGDLFLALTQSEPRVERIESRLLSPRLSLFENVDCDVVVSSVRQNSWYPDFSLKTELADEICTAARDAPLTNPAYPGFMFYEKDRAYAEDYLGQPIVFADYADLVESNSAIAAICADSTVQLIAQKYLGRWPKAIKPRLFMSFATEASNRQRVNQKQTLQFHYDTDAFRVLSFNFYLTDTDRDSGAHVLVQGTHGRKRLRHLLGTTNVPDDEISRNYPDGEVTIVSGRKGFGFVEDCYCLHKALIPITHDRLFLQIRCY